MLEQVLAYGARGWPVLPLWWAVDGSCACPGRDTCESPAKHPLITHGVHDASTDPGTVAAWFERWPRANVGIRTGVCFDALDVDGDEGFDECERLFGGPDAILPPGPLVYTPNNGVHLYFAPTGLGNRARFRPGLDWRGRDGYIVAPPSIGANGRRYEFWSVNADFELDRLSPVPSCVLDALAREEWTRVHPTTASAHPFARFRYSNPDGYGLAALEAEARAVASAPEGCRNDTLNRAAHTLARLVPHAVDAETVGRVLVAAACDAGLREHEAVGTIRSAFRARGLS